MSDAVIEGEGLEVTILGIDKLFHSRQELRVQYNLPLCQVVHQQFWKAITLMQTLLVWCGCFHCLACC